MVRISREARRDALRSHRIALALCSEDGVRLGRGRSEFAVAAVAVVVDADHDPPAGVDLALVLERGVGDLAWPWGTC
jgi:hypothetical protein